MADVLLLSVKDLILRRLVQRLGKRRRGSAMAGVMMMDRLARVWRVLRVSLGPMLVHHRRFAFGDPLQVFGTERALQSRVRVAPTPPEPRTTALVSQRRRCLANRAVRVLVRL